MKHSLLTLLVLTFAGQGLANAATVRPIASDHPTTCTNQDVHPIIL